MSLCFLEAFHEKEKGNITEEEYIHHILVHCQGVEHDEDEGWGESAWKLEDADPFGYSVRCWSLQMDHVQDITPLEDVFIAYRIGDVDEVKASLGRLKDEHAKYIRKSLAMLALQERRAGILKLCLDQGGFPFEHYFEDAANRFQDAHEDPEKECNDLETFDVLEGSRFRELYPRKAPRSKEELEAQDDLSEVFDRGGRLPVPW